METSCELTKLIRYKILLCARGVGSPSLRPQARADKLSSVSGNTCDRKCDSKMTAALGPSHYIRLGIHEVEVVGEE